MPLPYLRPLAAVAAVGLAAAGALVAQQPRTPPPPPPVGQFPGNPGQPPAGAVPQMPPRIRAILVERAQTLRGVADRLAELTKAPVNPARPEELFAARAAAGHAEVEAADTDAARLAILNRMLADTVAYEKLVADSIQANPVPATDLRGRVDRENALAQLKVGRLDLELAIEQVRGGGR